MKHNAAEMLPVFDNVAARQHPVVRRLLIDARTTPFDCNDPAPSTRFHSLFQYERLCRLEQFVERIGMLTHMFQRAKTPGVHYQTPGDSIDPGSKLADGDLL